MFLGNERKTRLPSLYQVCVLASKCGMSAKFYRTGLLLFVSERNLRVKAMKYKRGSVHTLTPSVFVHSKCCIPAYKVRNLW